MHSVKLPISPMWRLFGVEKVNTEFVLYWEHSGFPSLTPAERYILDIASAHNGSTCPKRRFWAINETVMDKVSELMVDAQEDADEAVMMAWLRFDARMRCPSGGELADRLRPELRHDDVDPCRGPHFLAKRKGADDAK